MFRDPIGKSRTVRLSRRDVEDARRLFALLAAENDDGEPKAQEPQPAGHCRGDLVEAARSILSRRRLREQVFGNELFGEPAWDILLLLYAGASGPRQTIGRLADSACIPETTAVRWVDDLEKRDLVRRDYLPNDRRLALIELSASGRRRLELYLADATDRDGQL